jgi:hypothetical protein
MEVCFILRRFVGFLAFLSVFVCLSAAFPGSAGADIFYAVSNYENGSAGTLAKNGGSFTVSKDVAANFGVDAWGFTFKDHNGAERAMIREYHYGANDTVYVWDPSNWNRPIINTNSWGTNFHAAAPSGQYLYLATYESYGAGSSSAEDTGEVVRVDMKNGYARDRAYHYERFTSESGSRLSPHAEGLYASGGRIYALFAMAYNGVNEYEASEIVEFDSELNVLRKVQLKNSSGKTGKNAAHMTYYGGKLYVVCMGGYQGPMSWGDVWEVDISNMTARQALDGRSIPYEMPDGTTAAVGMYGVQFASDGTAYLLTGSYDKDYKFRARLFVTTAGKLSNGDAGSVAVKFGTKAGYSWDILWDEQDSVLWCMAGTELQARDKNGGILRTFTPDELGDNIYSAALLNGSGTADTPDTPSMPDTPSTPDTPSSPENPENPGAPGDSGTKPEIKPVKPYIPGAPEGVEAVEPSALADEESLARFSDSTGIPMLWMTKGENGYVLGGSIAEQKAAGLWSGVKRTRSLPAFTAQVEKPGSTAAAGLALSGSLFMANRPSEIKIMEVRSGSKLPLKFSYSESGYADGTFRLQNSSGTAHTGTIPENTEYTLVLFIKDGGDYDLDGMADGRVYDPAVIVSAGQNDTPDGNSGSGSGGGGCGAGGFAPSAALAAAVLILKRPRIWGLVKGRDKAGMEGDER